MFAKVPLLLLCVLLVLLCLTLWGLLFTRLYSMLFWLNAEMVAKAALLLLSALWVLVCTRFYTVISRENVMQRRLIAIGAGLGAGLIYILGTMLLSLLQMPSPSEQRVENIEDVRVKAKPSVQ